VGFNREFCIKKTTNTVLIVLKSPFVTVAAPSPIMSRRRSRSRIVLVADVLSSLPLPLASGHAERTRASLSHCPVLQVAEFKVVFPVQKLNVSAMLIDRLKLFVTASVLALSVAQTAGGAELADALLDCRALASAVARVDCYDQLADTQTATMNQATQIGTVERAAPAVAATETAASATMEATADASQEAFFGKNEEEIRKSARESAGTTEIDQMDARVLEVRKSATGKAIITLDNGQVWKQIDSSRLRLSSDDQVSIRRASLGSFMLYKTGSKSLMRVKRIS